MSIKDGVRRLLATSPEALWLIQGAVVVEKFYLKSRSRARALAVKLTAQKPVPLPWQAHRPEAL
jgi:hypothetical protein